ncbi:MAG: S1C family serine protease [Holosporales bacterium]|jgi:S1-C subfamily serine protease|nr:S1C family serine protease [Holosporales bacterium]
MPRRIIIPVAILIALVQGYLFAKPKLVTKEQQAAIEAEAEKVVRESEVKDVVKKCAKSTVLIITISNEAKDSMFHNSAIEKRVLPTTYKYGVISGVCISENGVVVTTCDAILNADEIVVSIDSENKSISEDGELLIGKNDYKAKVLKLIPELNLAFLEIESRKGETFAASSLWDDSELIAGNAMIKNGAVVVGKAKGQFFTLATRPANVKPDFGLCVTFAERLYYVKENGLGKFQINNPATGVSILPENAGGGVFTFDGQLIGIPVFSVDSSLFPSLYVIPASHVKRGMQIAGLRVGEDDMLTDVGIEVKDTEGTEVPKSVRKILDIPDDIQVGVAIDTIRSKSPADVSGLQPGDVVLKFNEDIVENPETYQNLENNSIGDQTVTLRILRDNQLVNIEIRR